MFAERLKELRLEHDLKQSDVGHALNVSSQAIANYENEKREPRIVELIKLANYFDVSVDYLIGRTNIKETIK